MTTVNTMPDSPARAAAPAVAAAPRLTGKGPLPIVVGVTGHRDLRAADVPALERVVDGIITDAARKFPHSRLIVLSPLAEGSDRLVARVALRLGARLFVPLPLPHEMYEQDFATEASRAEFRQLLEAAESVFELPVMHGNTAHGIAEYGEQRNRQYGQVGAFIARHSQIFIALWDGVTGTADQKPGGTAEVVRFRLEGAPGRYEPEQSPLTYASIGTVHHIVTPRDGGAVPDQALTTRLLVPEHQTAESLEELPGWMDQFNEDVLDQGDALAAARETSKSWLLGVDVKDLQPVVDALTPSARSTLEHYAAADSLAVLFANQARKATWQLYLVVFTATLFFNMFHSLPQPHLPEEATLVEHILALPWLLILFLVTSFAGTLWVHRRAKEEDYQNKHQDYRALAEALRIQFFWREAGLPNAVVDHYLRKQRGALEWIRNALRAWDAETMHHRTSEDKLPPIAGRLAFVRRLWVTEQRNYYAKRARREQEKLESEEHKIERLVKFSVGLAMLLALVLSLPFFVPVHALESLKEFIEEPWIHGTVMLVIVTLAVIAGLRHGYDQQLALSEHAKQYGRMSELFDTAQRHLDALLAAGDHHHASELLKDLGEEALEENGDWVLLHRERPLEVPHSG